MTLSAADIKRYHEEGYLLLPRLFSREEMDNTLGRLKDLILERVPRPTGVRLQVEPALAGENSTGEQLLGALRKVECLVENDPVFHAFATDPRLLGPDIKLFRDALMMKPAHHGSAKPYHQDSAYWTIDPPDLCSAWIALDDATLENGCMRLLPGSHKAGLVEHAHREDFQVDEAKLDRSYEAVFPMEAGGVLLFHSMLLHATSPNRSSHARRAMIFSYMSARSRFTGDPTRKPDYLLLQGSEHPDAV